MEAAVLDRWRSRALRAEMKLHRANLGHNVSDMYTDDEWLVFTLEHKDGSAPRIDEVNAARARLNNSLG